MAGPSAALAWIVTIFILQFFRDPPRTIPTDAKAVLSPADGRVVKVEKGRDPYLDRDALKISVFMNVFNVHSNRSPVDGTVVNRWYHAGSFLNASLDKASLENERNALHIKAPNGQDVTCVQIAGLVARRILCYVEPGADAHARAALRLHPLRLARGRVPRSRRRRRKVAMGDTVSATETILAEFA